eukprot:3578530-Rhodomonas_salina.1
MELAEDGSVDKAALLTAIRNVSFEGGSGQVKFDEVGERDSEQPMILKNVRATEGPDGVVSLSLVTTWRWRSESGVMQRESSDPPIWPGGRRGWEL